VDGVDLAEVVSQALGEHVRETVLRYSSAALTCPST
jgi:hypothetical protein